MKITAEFNSNEELLSFINTFGANNIGKTNVDVKTAEKVTMSGLKKDSEIKEVNKVNEKVKVVEKEKKPQVNEKINDIQENKIKETNKKEDHKVTKEEVRAVFAKLIKEGKQKEAKDLTAKYGVSRIPDIKEEDYAAIKEEAEALL